VQTLSTYGINSKRINRSKTSEIKRTEDTRAESMDYRYYKKPNKKKRYVPINEYECGGNL